MNARDANEDPDVTAFYQRLFQAIEFGHAKAEDTLISNLLQHFGCPDTEDDPVQWFAARCEHSPEDVIVWLLNEAEPFCRMLEEIYSWLSDARATASGNIEEVAFDFGRLNERIPFSLESFPKTYVHLWRNRVALSCALESAARGHLRVDTPHYWRDDVPALYNLTTSPVLYPRDAFARLPDQNKNLIVACVKRVLALLESNYIRKEVDDPLWNHRVLYVRSEALWSEITATEGATLDDTITALLDSGDLVFADQLMALLENTECERDDDGAIFDIPPLISDDPMSDDTHAFLCAYRLAVKPKEITIRELVDVVDKVFLPFWRHRWRLFEVWSILWMRDAIPRELTPEPVLVPQVEGMNIYTWNLSGGDAVSPVASRTVGDHTLSIWFQLKSRLSDAAAERFQQAHIEPDVRVRLDHEGLESDVVILELKDRHLAQGSEEKRIARMYATTGAGVVCVANYSPFRAKHLHGITYTEEVEKTRIYVVDEFKPGMTPGEVRDAIQECLSAKQIDVLIDVSGSVSADAMQAVLTDLGAAGVSFKRWFVWANQIEEVLDREAWRAASVGGGTNLTQAVDAHRELTDARGIILTDADGLSQSEELRRKMKWDAHRYLCLDYAMPEVAGTIRNWLLGKT